MLFGSRRAPRDTVINRGWVYLYGNGSTIIVDSLTWNHKGMQMKQEMSIREIRFTMDSDVYLVVNKHDWLDMDPLQLQTNEIDVFFIINK